MHRQVPRHKHARLIQPLLWLIPLLLVSGTVISRPDPLAPEPTIRGVVKDAQGSPVANAHIRILDPRIARRCPDLLIGSMANLWLAEHPREHEAATTLHLQEVSTGSEGRFQIDLPEGASDAIALVEPSGEVPRLDRLAVGSPQEVRLDGGGDLRVRVLAGSESDKLVEGARATLVPLFVCAPALEAFGESLVRRAETGADGQVEFRKIPKGAYALRLVPKNQRVSIVGPIVSGTGLAEIRVRLPWAPTMRGSLSYPSHTPRSAGTIYAFWKGFQERFEWSEASFSPDSSEFEIGPLPYDPSLRFLVRTDSGLSSKLVSLESYGKESSIALYQPVSWRGSLEEGVKATSLVAQFLTSTSLPSELLQQPMIVPVGPGGRFVIPDVPTVAEVMRLAARGIGMAEVRLDEGSSGDLGLVKLSEGSPIEGRVVWENGEPLDDGKVEILSAAGVECSTRVTHEGAFACSSRNQGRKDFFYRASVDGAGFLLKALPGKEGVLALAPPAPVDLSLSRAGGKGKAEDLKIEFEGGEIRFARAPLGALRMHLADRGPLRLNVSNADAGPGVAVTLNPDATAEGRKTIVAVPGAERVFGTVASALSRKPIEEGEIEIIPGSVFDDDVRISYVTHSGEEGSWRFAGMREGSYELIASAEGYSSMRRRASVPGETRNTPQALLLRQFGRIQGKVLGLPEKVTATLRASSRSWWLTSRKMYEATTNEKGDFRIESVQPDRYDLYINVKKSPPERASRNLRLEVRPAETSEVEVDLRGGIFLSGRAYLGEAPLPRARLSFFRVSKKKKGLGSIDVTTTDDEGRFRLLLPKPGLYNAIVWTEQVLRAKGGGSAAQLDRILEVGPQPDQSQDLRFSEGGMQGRIVNQDGAPVSGVAVEINTAKRKDATENENDLSPSVQYYATSSDEGRFEFRPLPAGDFLLSVTGGGMAHKEVGPVVLLHDQSIVLPDIVLDPEVSLRVKVLGPTGAPLRKAYVTAMSFPALEGRDLGGGVSDEEGSVLMRGLSPGTYTLVAKSLSLSPAFLEQVKVPLEEPGTPIVLQCLEGGSLDVQIQTKAGKPVPDLTPVLIDAQGRDVTGIYSSFSDMPHWTDGEGRARLLHLVPGEYVVRARTSASSDSKKVTISAGGSSQVYLTAEEEPAD